MTATARLLLAAAFGVAILSPALAQSTSPPSGSSGAMPTASSPASSGLPTGKSAIGRETATEKREQRRMDRDMNICKGC